MSTIIPVLLAPNFPPLEGMMSPNGKSGAAIRSLCHFLSIDVSGQLQRIKRQPELAAALQFVTITTIGGPKPVAMLEGYAIAIWAAGLQTSRLSPGKQEAVALLKQHAYSAIARAFSQPEMAESEPIPP